MIHQKTRHFVRIALFTFFLGFIHEVCAINQKWVGTWYTAPQLVEPHNMPPAPGLTNNSLRQIVRISIAGEQLRLRLSNEFSGGDTEIKAVRIAASAGSGSIHTSTEKALTFDGNTAFTMQAGEVIVSDPIDFALQSRMDLAITIDFGQTPSNISGHPGSRTTSYLNTGSQTLTTDHWYIINGIDVLVPETHASVAIVGNSITDGRGSITNQQNRWTDIFSENLLAQGSTEHIGVLNSGIGGNCVLANCLGPSAISRYERDAVNQAGIRWIVIYEGVNDIGGLPNTEAAATQKANELINAYKQMIAYAHVKNIRVYGATIMPFKNAGYYSEYRDVCRNLVNEWIRTSGYFDGVIDFDAAMRDPQDPAKMLDAFQDDYLHPNAAGHKRMGDAVPLDLFLGSDTIFSDAKTGEDYLWFEAERFVTDTEGHDFEVFEDLTASNEKAIRTPSGTQSTAAATITAASLINIPFTASKDSTYNVYARLNCPNYDDDSFYFRMDNESFVMQNGLVTGGWEWKLIGSYPLTKGQHVFSITYREDGAALDKICITTSNYAPMGMGFSDPILSNKNTGIQNNPLHLSSYPNPATEQAFIEFEIPASQYVSLKLRNLYGQDLMELAGREFNNGRHLVDLNTRELPDGLYIYTLQTNDRKQSKTMLIQR